MGYQKPWDVIGNKADNRRNPTLNPPDSQHPEILLKTNPVIQRRCEE
jgi:hypothetical protein